MTPSPTPGNSERRRRTAVSQSLHAIQAVVECAPSKRPVQAPRSHRILVAHSAGLRARARKLVHRVYVRAGYAGTNEPEPSSYLDDDSDHLFTVLAQAGAHDAATVSLAYDNPAGLPCDEIFSEYVNELRARGRRIAEVTRLAIAPDIADGRMILVRLFNFIYIHARKLRNADDFVIEVNPRHVDYYRRLMGFETLGDERPCPRVQGAPARLLRMDLAVGERAIRAAHTHCMPPAELTAELARSLYPQFLAPAEETQALAYIRAACELRAKRQVTGAVGANPLP